MSSDATNEAIVRSAARLRVATFVVMTLFVLLCTAAHFDLPAGQAHVDYRVSGPPGARWIADVSVMLLLVALWRLTQMLGRISSGELFSSAVISRFKSFAFWLLLTALFGLLAPAMAQFLQFPATEQLAFVIDFSKLVTVGVTLVLFLIARLLERARQIEQENREIV